MTGPFAARGRVTPRTINEGQRARLGSHRPIRGIEPGAIAPERPCAKCKHAASRRLGRRGERLFCRQGQAEAGRNPVFCDAGHIRNEDHKIKMKG